jgi:methylated-DNA-[protein]-cysteine S-methyltransferase
MRDILDLGLPPDASREAARRLVARAGEEGLVDVAYAVVDSPVGPLLAAGTRRGLVEIGFRADTELDSMLEQLAGRISPRVLEAPDRLDPVRRELDEYFEGRRLKFDLPLDWSLSRGFTQRVLRATAKVPYGRVSTYREMAAKAGNEKAVRAAGNALGANPIPIVVPCHRILRTGGALGGYGGGPERKEFLLRLEGVLES